MKNSMHVAKNKYDTNDTNTLHRCLSFIERLASRHKLAYKLEDWHNDWLYANILDFEDNAKDEQDLREACRTLLLDSLVMQGINHPEPADIARYQMLFNHNEDRLCMTDTVFSPIPTVQLVLETRVTADDPAVLRLTPNVQLGLFENA